MFFSPLFPSCHSHPSHSLKIHNMQWSFGTSYELYSMLVLSLNFYALHNPIQAKVSKDLCFILLEFSTRHQSTILSLFLFSFLSSFPRCMIPIREWRGSLLLIYLILFFPCSVTQICPTYPHSSSPPFWLDFITFTYM